MKLVLNLPFEVKRFMEKNYLQNTHVYQEGKFPPLIYNNSKLFLIIILLTMTDGFQLQGKGK